VDVRSDDPIINLVIDKIAEQIRSQFGGDVDVARDQWLEPPSN
jgi:hypothetical protein